MTEKTKGGDVRLSGISKTYGSFTAVHPLDLDIPTGSFFALLGPSGCGKTTTLRMIAGLEDPTTGTVRLGGQDVTALPPYKRPVNTVFQSYALFPHLDVYENVAFGLRRRGVKGGDLNSRVGKILELVQLGGYEKRKPQQLSGGQAQRVALARALVNSPRVLLLDEPLGALDLKLRKEMQLFIKGLQSDLGITFIHVTHDQEEAMTMADSIAVMNAGRIEQLGAPTELYEHPETAFVAGFLGVSNLLRGESDGNGVVRLHDGTVVSAPTAKARGPVAVGIRPEKISIGGSADNTLSGVVKERAYIGVSTQYIVETASGLMTVYVQNADPGAGSTQAGDRVTLGWSADATFVVQDEEDNTHG
jgi:spermidine/putrescine transport system ATP-binding protein